MLIGLLPGPHYYTPFWSIDRADKRKSLVLQVMHENDLLDFHDFTFYRNKKLQIANRDIENYSGIAPYFKLDFKINNKNIDILIMLENIVICIENKVLSKEHSNQLKRYKEIVDENFSDYERSFVYLTPEGEKTFESDGNEVYKQFNTYHSYKSQLKSYSNILIDNRFENIYNFLYCFIVI